MQTVPELDDSDLIVEVKKDDPLVMYLIVNMALNMSTGKIAAQCAHAAQLATLRYKNLANIVDGFEPGYIDLHAEKVVNTFDHWNQTGYTKIVLRASQSQFDRIKNETEHIVVIDLGQTEIPAGSETVLALMPQLKSQAPKFIKRLQLL